MIPRGALQVLEVSADPEINLAVIRDSGHSRFPVLDAGDGGEIIGIVLAKDLYTAMLHGDCEPWKDLRKFCREPLVVPESQKLARLFEAMRLNRAHMACVVDEYGDLAGIVTLEDLLEEIVGEIRDETDVESEQEALLETAPGHWRADSLVSLSDVERVIGLKVPAELDANTLSGLFMQRLARMPKENDSIEESGFRLTVRSVDDRRVSEVAIERISDAEPSSAEGAGQSS
jgi:CBS domain containing-hemolysin-like protein